jgi:hypothetical protein
MRGASKTNGSSLRRFLEGVSSGMLDDLIGWRLSSQRLLGRHITKRARKGGRYMRLAGQKR